MTAVFQPITPRASAGQDRGLVPWIRDQPVRRPGSSVATTVIVAATARLLAAADLLDWAVFNAVCEPERRRLPGGARHGACWGVIAEKYRLIIFGRYPFEQQWRPELATLLLVGLLVVELHPHASGSPGSPCCGSSCSPAFFVLMGGGVFGLAPCHDRPLGRPAADVMLATLSDRARLPAGGAGGARPALATCRRSAPSASSTSS